MSKLRNILIGAGIATVGGIGIKKAVDYFQDKQQEEAVIPPVISRPEEEAIVTDAEEVAFAVVESSSVQDFLDKSFGSVGRYTPNRPPKIFEYQDQQYMVIWAYDQEKSKDQMLVFLYTDGGREMIASVGYTNAVTDYRLHMGNTPFAVEINGSKLKSGEGETDGTSNVDFVLA